MPRRFGSDSSFYNTLNSPIVDPNGITVIDPGNKFGSSPLGVALREQAAFGLPNASFNLLPPDPNAAINETDNPLPFWRLQTTNTMSATPAYDTTNQTWGIKIDPGTAASGDYLTLKTRAWITTDDNVALRQKASLALTKVGTYSGSTQWNLTLTAVNYDHTNTAVSTAVIGTVYDNTTWTSISGTTTPGGSAIPSTVSWVEFTIKLTATATVSSSTGVTLQSLLLASSTPLSNSFVVTQAFPSSTTWTPPTGVTNLLSVLVVGGGGGGAGGLLEARTATTNSTNRGAPGGSGGAVIFLRNVSITAGAAITIGIGTAGNGGTASTFTKALGAGTAGIAITVNPTNGANGGATTFGTYVTAAGGVGGTVATLDTQNPVPANPQIALDGAFPSPGAGGAGTVTVSGNALKDGTNLGGGSIYTVYPMVTTLPSAAAAGTGTISITGTGVGTSWFRTVSGTAGSPGFGGGGGADYRWTLSGTDAGSAVGNGGAGAGGASGRSMSGSVTSGTVTMTLSAGVGGAGGVNSGAGGGGGGQVAAYLQTASAFNLTSGVGGAGGAGFVVVSYVG
jgi:hypothetical protein